RIFKVSAQDGSLKKDITINNATHIDWEDITQDANYIYINDAGNNSGSRKDLKIYKINKATLLDKDKDEAVSVLNFTYKDQKNFAKRNYQHNFDCEAISIIENELHLFSKNHANKACDWYTLNTSLSEQEIKPYGHSNPEGLITGSAYDPTHKLLAFCGYMHQANGRKFQPFMVFHILDGKNAIRSEKVFIDMEAQIEAICLIEDGLFYLSSEKSKGKKGSVFQFDAKRYLGL
ncbi:MAG: hypothetical protein AAGK97_01275, partial [Bacteroidota bacterium]